MPTCSVPPTSALPLTRSQADYRRSSFFTRTWWRSSKGSAPAIPRPRPRRSTTRPRACRSSTVPTLATCARLDGPFSALDEVARLVPGCTKLIQAQDNAGDLATDEEIRALGNGSRRLAGMKLFFSGRDYIHKVLVVAAEAGVLDRLEFVTENPLDRDAIIWEVNPLGRHPVLVLGRRRGALPRLVMLRVHRLSEQRRRPACSRGTGRGGRRLAR